MLGKLRHGRHPLVRLPLARLAAPPRIRLALREGSFGFRCGMPSMITNRF
jgi:hypothetical protein